MKINCFFSVLNNQIKKFWFGYSVALIGTVFVVYVTTSIGFKSLISGSLVKVGLKDSASEERQAVYNSYKLQNEFLKEVRGNVGKVEIWAEKYKIEGSLISDENYESPSIDNSVWLSMKDSPYIFSIPSEVLTGVRRYYRVSERILRDGAYKERGASSLAPELLEATMLLKKNIIPKLEKNIQRLRDGEM